MLDWIRTQFAPPIFEGDEDKTRIASLLHIILSSLLVMGLIFVPIAALTKGSYPGVLIITGMLAALAPVMLLMLRRGYVESVSVLLVSLLFVAAIGSVSVVGSIRVPVASLFILCVVIAGLLIGHRGTVIVAVLSLVALLGLWWAETASLLSPYVHEAAGFAPWLTLAVLLISTAVLLILATHGLNDALERVRRSEQALTESNRRLKAEIAERTRVEEALRTSEEEHRRVVQNANEAIFVLQAGRFALFNPKALEITGYSGDELAPKHYTELVHPDDRDMVVERHRKRLQGEQVPDVYSFRIVDKGGNIRWVEIRVVVIDWKGEHATLNFTSDITERKRAERLLHALNEAARAMEQALTQEGICAAIADEFKKLGFACVVFLTDASKSRLFPKYFSYEAKGVEIAEKLLGLEAEDLALPVESTDVFMETVQKRKTVLVEGGAAVWQVLPEPLKRFAGQVVDILQVPKSIIAPLIVEEAVIGLLAVQSDDLTEGDIPAITAFAYQMAATWRKAVLLQDLAKSLEELKQTQAQFLQAQKMEAVGRLAGGVAHDFNNLLTTIIGYTDLLLGDFASSDPIRADLEQVRKAADRAAALTQKLLAFSRKQVLQPKVLDLNAVVAGIEEMLRRLIGEDIHLVTILRPEIGRVQADPGQIEQVLMNLVVNARDAMPAGGRLTIETANVDLDETRARLHIDAQPGRYVMLVVSDTGIGMDKETQSHLFEPFFTTKERDKGTGLGLSTVYGIVKQSGGNIYVHSEPEQGTTFKVYLPRIDETAEMPGSFAVPTGLLQGSETILLVEDEDMVRALARRILLQSGYTVLEARDADEAIQLCAHHSTPIHLVMTDVVLPGRMSGPDLVKHLKTSRPEIQVFYVSGYTDDAIVHHGVLDPEVAFLQKPFTPEALARKVRKVLDASLSET